MALRLAAMAYTEDECPQAVVCSAQTSPLVGRPHIWMHISIYLYLYIYIYIFISRNMGGQILHAPTVDIPGRGGTFFDFAVFFIEKAARSSRSCDGP